MPGKSAHVKNEKQYEALKDKGMSKERAAKIANSPAASKHGGEHSHSGSTKSDSSQGGTHAQKVAAGRKGGKATAAKHCGTNSAGKCDIPRAHRLRDVRARRTLRIPLSTECE